MQLTWRQLTILKFLVTQVLAERRYGRPECMKQCGSTAELTVLRKALKAAMADGALAVARRQNA